MSLSEQQRWGRFRYSSAPELPGVLAELARLPEWRLAAELPLDPLWEAVGLAIFNFGDVPDVAYAFLPELLDVATRKERSVGDARLVVGCVVDSTLGALPGACEIPADLAPRFFSCLETCRRIALGWSLGGLSEGEVSALVSARLLSDAGLTASYLVSASRSEVLLVCPSCRSVVWGELSLDGWQLTNTDGQTVEVVVAETSRAWQRFVASMLEPVMGGLAVAEQLLSEPAFSCPGCRRTVHLGQGAAFAVAGLPVARHSWRGAVEAFL